MEVTRKVRKTRKRSNVPWAGWANEKPSTHERTIMLKECGRKCFLGPRKSFPICTKNTCKINRKGIWAAYIRSRQWGKKASSYRGKTRPTHKRRVYTRVARKAKRMLNNKKTKKTV